MNGAAVDRAVDRAVDASPSASPDEAPDGSVPGANRGTAAGPAGDAVSAWLPLAPCTPGRCVTDPVPYASRARRLARYAAGTAALLTGIALSPLALSASRARRDRLTALWCRGVVRAFGVRARITGDRPAGEAVPRLTGCLVVANHVSWLDVPLVAAVRPGRMVAKKEVAAYPVLGWLAARGATLFLDRDRLRALPGAVAGMAAALRAGTTVVVFPEGSTWCGRRQGRFRNAAFQAAIDAGVPVQPVRLRYGMADGRPTSAAAFVGEDTLVASVRRVVAVRCLVADVTVLPPIAPGTYSDRGSLARAAATAVSHAGVGKAVPAAEGDMGPADAGPGGTAPEAVRPGTPGTDSVRGATTRAVRGGPGCSGPGPGRAGLPAPGGPPRSAADRE
jgi:1-acyl-sn-glycerol-3-phosphate acyltransferase